LKSSGTYKQVVLPVSRLCVMTLPRLISKRMNRLILDHSFTYQTGTLVHEITDAGINIVPLEVERHGMSMSQDGTIS
jgi:hypothetical protein